MRLDQIRELQAEQFGNPPAEKWSADRHRGGSGRSPEATAGADVTPLLVAGSGAHPPNGGGNLIVENIRALLSSLVNFVKIFFTSRTATPGRDS